MPGPGAHVAGEPLDPVEWTGTWKDTRWPERKPEWLLTGTDFRMNGVNDKNAVLVYQRRLRLAPRVAELRTGHHQPDPHQRGRALKPTPCGRSRKHRTAVILAAQNINIDGSLRQRQRADLLRRRDPVWGIISQRYDSGAVVVGFGTCQWSWALDSVHDRVSTAVSAAGQQFMVNLLRDLGAAPATLMAGMTLSDPAPLDAYGTMTTGGGNVRDGLGSPFRLLTYSLVELDARGFAG